MKHLPAEPTFGDYRVLIRLTNSKVHDLAEEAADVFWLLIDLCNRLDIDLEKAFRAKEHKNQQRKWS